MPAILLEGCDGAGKTTFVHMLANAWKERYPLMPVYRLHRSQPTPLDTWKSEYIDPLFRIDWAHNTGFTSMNLQLLDPGELVIMDRWHIGELIYGPLYRGTSMLNDDGLAAIESTLDLLGVHKILLKPSLRTVQRRLRDRGEDFLRMEDVPRVYRSYVDIVSGLKNWTLLPRTSRKVAEMIVSELIDGPKKTEEPHVTANAD